jgi:hypothetical protein
MLQWPHCITKLLPFSKRARDSRRILDSDNDADDNSELIVGTEKTVSENSPAPLAASNNNESLNDAEKPVIVAEVRLFCPCFDYQVMT